MALGSCVFRAFSMRCWTDVYDLWVSIIVVVNCAAYTQVDKAESEPERAFAINRDAARAIAQGVNNYGGRLLQVSTDFIFAGDRSVPYREDV